ncbi:tetratricopeptide repeat protein [Ignatzschineria sp. LJL83]
MFKRPAKKILLSLVLSSLILPAIATTPLEDYINQTFEQQSTVIATEPVNAFIEMDHYDRHSALINQLDSIKKGAAKNQADDLFLLGFYHYSEAEDNSNEEDYLKAKEYFLQAEALGSKEASYLLGEIYYYGEGVSRNYATAAEYYEKAALQNQKEALFSLGSLYQTDEFQVDYPKSLAYFEKAAALKSQPALRTLAYYYENGTDSITEINLQKANELYQQACELGDESSCNDTERLKYLTLSFDDLMTDIISEYPALSATGKALPNPAEITELDTYYQLNQLNESLPDIILQAQKKNSDAIYLLGLYYNAIGDDQYDSSAYIKAKVLLEKAIELGADNAMYELAELYYYGNGVQQDYHKSLELYSHPKLAKHPEAIFSRGVQYDLGEGVPQSYEISFALFKEASELDHNPSTFNVGYMYEYGQFVDIDLELAKEWYQKSCDNNYEDGCEAIQLLEEDNAASPALDSLFDQIMEHETPVAPLELTTTSILNADPERARVFLSENSDLLLENIQTDNNGENLFLAGYLFYLEALESGNNHTYAQATTLLEKAAEKNFSEANFYLGVMAYNGNGNSDSFSEDYTKALSYLEKMEPAHHNYSESLFYLATMHDQGLGTEQDQEKSFELYQTAANLGHKESAYNVGYMYEHGEFVAENTGLAKTWYQSACDLGDIDGCEKVDYLNEVTELPETDTEILEEERVRNPVERELEDLFEIILETFTPL